MGLSPFQQSWPQLAPDAFIAQGAQLVGRVTVGAQSSIWFNAVLRADLAPIAIGVGSNVQDNSTIHVDFDQPAVIGDSVTIGHGVTIHGATIEDQVLIGMGAVVLNGARIGRGSIVGAHTLITEGKEIPPRSLVLGSPGRVVRPVSDEEVRRVLENARHYVELAGLYLGRAPALQEP